MAVFESYAQGTPCYVEVMSPDQHATRDFYVSLFGWGITETPIDEEGHVYLSATIGDGGVAGIGGHLGDLAGQPAFWVVYLAVDDVDAAVARVGPAGGTVDAGPFDVMGFGRMAAITDPTGARVSLWQAGSMIGTERANEPGTPTWHELMTPDVERAKQFYTDVLGVGWETTPMPEGDYHSLVVAGRPVAGLMASVEEGMPPWWSVYFLVTDLDETVQRVPGLGGALVVPAFDVPGVGRMAVLADPQGGVFSLMQHAVDPAQG